MLDSSFLKLFFITILLFSCGGGNNSASQPNETYSVVLQNSFSGYVLDGYIRNAEVWVETTNDFSSQGEFSSISNNLGKFTLSTSESIFRVQSFGGIDLDTNNTLEGLTLINHRIDDLITSSNLVNYILSPLTTADFFLSESLSKLNNPVSTSINNLLGLDPNLNINTTDHVQKLSDGYIFAEAYEKANQLTSLTLSLAKLVSNFNSTDIDTNSIFSIILDKMITEFQSSQSEVNLESGTLLDQIVDEVIVKFSLSIQEQNKIKLKNMVKAFLPLIQVKPNLVATHGIFNFATNNFFNDLIAVASGNDSQNIYLKYSSNLISYIAEISGQSEASLAFTITANTDSITSFEDQLFNIDVLQNDDFDSESSLNIAFTQPLNGTITKNNSNILVYQPNQDFNGNDSFTYTLEQGSLKSTATVNISVQPLPDAPVISISSSQITIPENQLSTINISASDADGDSLSFSLSGNDASFFNISNNGQISFKAAPDYETKSLFLLTVTVSDGSLTDSINLSINISDISHEIDLLIYYAPDMLSFWSSEEAITTRVLYLITSANNALIRSKSEIKFNLLKLLPYDVNVSNQSGSTIFSSLLGRAKIKKDQVLYGADYFILISRWDSAKGQTGGTASIDLSIDNIIDWDASHGFLSAWSVDPNWSEPGCSPCFPDKVFAHELGHNLGSGHWPGETGQSYAFGHRVDGNTDGDFTDNFDWGTIMSYNNISPDYFSNPDVVCKNNLACGVVNVSDNTKWYNNLGTRFASILPASNLNPSSNSKKINIKNYFPKISGGTSTFSNAGINRIFSITEFADVDINGQTYKSFKWENTLSGVPKMAYYFYEKDDKYYVNRTDYESGYKFSNQDEYTIYDNNNLCTFFDAFQNIGSHLARNCRNAHYGDPPTFNDVYHFNHFINSENITVPYGTFNTVKYVFTLWDNNDSPYGDTPYLMHTIFWLSPEMGVVQYRDHLGRIWKLENADSDGDGIANKLDSDDDNDGVLDISDAFNLDPLASVDSNLDGIPD